MRRFQTMGRMLSGEEGHAITLPGTLLSGSGAILLAIGGASDNDVVIIIGGIVLAVGLLAASLLAHMGIDYGIFGRLDELEKK